MPRAPQLSDSLLKRIDRCVSYFDGKRGEFEHFAKVVSDLLLNHPELRGRIHSIKFRVKDSDHLRKKLIKKAKEASKNGKKFNIDENNLFRLITDLAGVRVLHLYTNQLREINPALLRIFDAENYKLVEVPIANTWDDENKRFFKELKIKISSRDSLYTSVHYVIASSSKAQMRCEVQVRTLSEEVWGEVSHTINYPEPTSSMACSEQLKVLARVTSSCTRLVDSIFSSHKEHLAAKRRTKKPKKK
jgi:putative GTP pyrophosphokinase